ncbi:uncharacterized protein LOC111704906 isoform X3 [Eurytemora carolleeae]|uniref:uncharacterized protein LOC111704906 isoform X1 n=1 Tax=Eurytemora carolleeae TaxID=1294199 RepID=UPI000C771315|nr:uncharacterized protein LOC111704906 isoform X1 [Eurytemora carolleeae]XP_023333064.1 uncharacterized protein LOC111704906 isoform X3 [Eurytemora carolleeae]|eukprot:XP_023333062.1 uncharacterized protein LOC111704906 isoform X1 [Eurytemora affinis]
MSISGLGPSTLENQCITRYLYYLESVCATYIHLTTKDESGLFKALAEKLLPMLKEQLGSSMSGTVSSIFRQEMLRRIFSGEFPSSRYRLEYTELNTEYENIIQPLTEGRDILRQMKKHGEKCCSPCCTGVYIVETMACVVMNDEIQELKIDSNIQNKIVSKQRPVRNYIGFDIPSILSHYQASVKQSPRRHNIPLERFIIHNTELHSHEFSSMHIRSELILGVYQETQDYLDYPTILSASADPGESVSTRPYSEDLYLNIAHLFSAETGARFPRLTEITFGSELGVKLSNLRDRYGELVIVKLFQGIGHFVPNLKIFDVSASLSVPTEAFIHLFLRDANNTLHRYMYLPPYQKVGDIVCYKYDSAPEEFYKHRTDQYCPWCRDEWGQNSLRPGCVFLANPIPIVDDRLYQDIETKYPELGPMYLANVVRASDFCKSIHEPNLVLRRPPGPKPWQSGFVLPEGMPEPIVEERLPPNRELRFYPLKEGEKVEYIPDLEDGRTRNILCASLQVLNIGQMGPRHEILPFLLLALPQIKSLGSMDVLRGLKFMKDNPNIQSDFKSGLEEVSIDVVTKHYSHDWLTATRWAPDPIKKDVEEFYKLQDNSNLSIEEKRSEIRDDVQLLCKACPNISKIRLFLYAEDFPNLLKPEYTCIWEGLSTLTRLTEVTILCIDWEHTTALLTVVGSKLTRVCVSVCPGRTALDDTSPLGPSLDRILSLCTNLQSLKVDVSGAPLNISQGFLTPKLDLLKLKTVSVGNYLTKEAFEWLWESAVNLEEILIPTICTTNIIQIFNPHTYQVYFTKQMFEQLLKKNRMKKMVKMKAFLCIADMQAAEYLVDTLSETCPHLEEIGKLTIRVKLEEEHYPEHDDLLTALAEVMRQISRFRQKSQTLYRSSRKLMVNYVWEKTGLFNSFGEIDPLNALIDPPVQP